MTEIYKKVESVSRYEMLSPHLFSGDLVQCQRFIYQPSHFKQGHLLIPTMSQDS